MTAVTADTIETYAITVPDANLSSSPPAVAVSSHAATDASGMVMRFRRKGRGLALTEADSGIVVAWSTPHRVHQHSIAHRGHRWQLDVDRSRWGSDRPSRRGFAMCPDLGAASIDATYVHYVSDWRDHRRFHRAWTTGSLCLEDDVPGPVLTLAMRLTLGRRWFDLRRGDWVETRREWDFAGF